MTTRNQYAPTGPTRTPAHTLMPLWTPSRTEPELLEWWSALLLVARAAREDRVPWPVHVDEFDLLGRVDRTGSAQPIWVYRHRRSGGDIHADPSGQTYCHQQAPGRGGSRFERCTVRASIHLAGLPEVVKPIFYQEDLPQLLGWPAETDEESSEAMSSHPSAQRPGGCGPARPRASQGDRWLHVVPTVPA